MTVKDSPLAKWLRANGVTQAELGSLAGVNHTVVSRASTGVQSITGGLRTYLALHAPDVLAAQDRYTAKRLQGARERLEAA